MMRGGGPRDGEGEGREGCMERACGLGEGGLLSVSVEWAL